MEPFPNSSECNFEPVSGKCMKHHTTHEEMVQYLENLKVMIEDCRRKDQALRDKHFFELRLDIYLLFKLLRRSTDSLAERIARLENARNEGRQSIEVSLPYWALN